MHLRTITVLTLASLAFLGAASLSFAVAIGARQENRELAKLSGDLDTAARREKIARSIEALTKDTAGARADLDTRFVGTEGIAPFLELVETLGREMNLKVEITSVSVEKPAGGGVIETLRVTAVAEGAFGNSYAFLTLLESLPYPVIVRQVSLEIPDRETGGLWKETVTFSVAKLI